MRSIGEQLRLSSEISKSRHRDSDWTSKSSFNSTNLLFTVSRHVRVLVADGIRPVTAGRRRTGIVHDPRTRLQITFRERLL